MARKILITDDLHPLLQQGLEQDGFTVDYRPAITEKEVLEIIGDYEGLVINSKVYAGKELLDKATQLKFVCRAGSGLEVIDLPYAKEKNVAAFNSPEGNRNAVAEQALGMLLNLMNNISKAHYEVRNKQWIREANRGHELAGKTIGLIAFGHTAQAFAKILRGFDVKVLAYDKYKTGFSDGFVTEATLDEIYKQAEIVSVHLPLTDETKYMIDYGFLSSFHRPFWLINTSRGKVLRTADLIKTLEEGKVMAAALDVLENEKLETLSANEQEDFGQLIQHNRILLTPHIAGWTHESKRRIAEVLLEKIRKVYSRN
ncbi:MAG TPA: NAD(P)-dependent oxidoreductase [Chitinophagales bacterium]|nr:NAD(P)-dependent oxidoreductase [Chitinophagales bacterium]